MSNSFKLAISSVFFLSAIFSGCTKSCKQEEATNTTPPAQSQSSTPGTATESNPATASAPGAATTYDLTPDAAGLSKAIVVMKTSKGTLKFKFYSKDAPNTVKRFAELVQSK